MRHQIMDIKRKRTTKRDESNIRARLNETLLRHIDTSDLLI